MDHASQPEWRDRFLLAAQAVTPSERNRLASLATAGRLVRLAPGVYLDPHRGDAGQDGRHRDRVRARAIVAPDAIFSHASAAAMWGLPRIGAWPERVDVVAERATGGRSTPGVRQHRVGIPDALDRIDGIRVTTVADTVMALAASDRLDEAVVAADAALRGFEMGAERVRVGREDLHAAAPRRGRGAAVARFVAAFADGRSESPGETLSRLAMHRAGVPAPELQLRLADRRGAMLADFAWPDHGVVGEFDGVAKYVREEFACGRTPAQVVVDEKRREDRIRALGWRVVRWGWEEARSVPAMRRILWDAGVR